MNKRTLNLNNCYWIGTNKIQRNSGHEQHNSHSNNHILLRNNWRTKQNWRWQTQPL